MIDARERVTGRVEYVMDVKRPGMLYAAVARSTRPHATITRIDVDDALRTPGVRAVLTAADIERLPGVRLYHGPVLRDQPILAKDVVRFIGEPIVAIAADTPEAAAEAAHSVQVEYEDLPAVFDAAAALEASAPVLHTGEREPGPSFPDIVLHTEPGTNVCNLFKLRKGDVDAALAGAVHVFEDSFHTPPVQHVPFETHVCVAEFDGDGALTLWDSTQTPFVMADLLADMFGLERSRVRVIVPTLGGAYGAKCYTKIEPITTVLALASGRPVRFHLTREEEFVTVTKHGSDLTIVTGLDADGRIVARRTTCLFNTGAYADIGPRVVKNGGYGSPGPYKIPHVHVDSYAVYTNLPPAGAYRGYGQPQSAWAYETQMDMIAERLDMDPLELRKINLLESHDAYHTGEDIGHACFHELLDRSAAAIGWDWNEPPVRDGHRVRAKGFAVAIKGTVTPSRSEASVRIDGDGTVNVFTSSVEMGQGVQTALAIMAAERLGVPIEAVRVSSVDTDTTPYDQQTSSSRTTHCMGNALAIALDEVAAKRDAQDADLTGYGVFTTGGVLDPHTGQGQAAAHWHQAAGAAEVEVDLETGKVEVLRYHAATYAGRVINSDQADMQTHGNVAFGVAQTLFEEMVFEDGQLSNANLGEYMIASLHDLPRSLVVDNVEAAGSEIHGLGETALPPVAPAIGNAISRAIGRRLTSLPLTPERVLREVREHNVAEAS
jgi:CO/xanthine dehydrogenase Mo-binding subunit